MEKKRREKRRAKFLEVEFYAVEISQPHTVVSGDVSPQQLWNLGG
jgi:hypothetical protein